MAEAQESRETAQFEVKGRKIELYRPSTGQMFVVLTLIDLQDEEDQGQQIEMVLNFGTVMRTLFVDEADRRWVLRSLSSDGVSLDEYVNLARDIINEWEPEQASNRAERRAPAKRAAPAKRVSARKRT